MLKHPSLTMHLVVVGRIDPPIPISRLRAKGQVTEIRAQDLRFKKAETKIFLEQLLGFPIDPSTVAAVEKKTEGWVTGLRLAALSMSHRGNLDPTLVGPQVDTQYVMEYLFSEVFPANRRRSANIFWPPLFLIASAVRCARRCVCRRPNRLPAKLVVGSLSTG